MAPPKSKSNQCIIQSIDTMIAINIKADTTGQQLIDTIFAQIGVCEKHWFGLLYYDLKSNLRWQDLKKKVNLKEIKPFEDTTAHYKFTIQYFPENMRLELIQDSVKTLFFKFELSRLVGDPDMECLPEHRILFAVAYAAMVSYEHPKFSPDDIITKKFDRLFPPHVLKQFDLSKKEWLDVIMPSLEIAKGQHYTEPLSQALDAMEQSPLHGVSFYSISNKNGTELLLGIDCYGLTIYKPNDRINPVLAFHWQEIYNVSYSGRAFHIRPLAKEDPELVIYTRSARQNDEILTMIAGNHSNYLKRRKGDPELELEITEAKKAQEFKIIERKRFEKQKEANMNYEAQVNKIINTSGSNDKGAKLEEEYKKTKELMSQQIEEARKQAEAEKKMKDVAEKEAEEMRKVARDLEEKMKKEHVLREEFELMESARVSADEARAKEVQELTKQLQELEDRHKKDLERLAEIEKGNKAAEVPATAVKTETYEESKKTKNNEMKAHLNKVGTLLKQKNKVENSAVSLMQQNVEQGRDKFATLKMLRKNNTKARVDEFESF